MNADMQQSRLLSKIKHALAIKLEAKLAAKAHRERIFNRHLLLCCRNGA
jgi:hypothetical protein